MFPFFFTQINLRFFVKQYRKIMSKKKTDKLTNWILYLSLLLIDLLQVIWDHNIVLQFCLINVLLYSIPYEGVQKHDIIEDIHSHTISDYIIHK